MYNFTFHRPTTVRQAAGLLARNPEAKLLAGGHSLLPVMKQRLAQPSAIVDLALVEGMIAERHDVGAGSADGLEVPLGQPAPMARILAVDDNEVEGEAGDKLRQPLAQCVAPRPADHITQEQ